MDLQIGMFQLIFQFKTKTEFTKTIQLLILSSKKNAILVLNTHLMDLLPSTILPLKEITKKPLQNGQLTSSMMFATIELLLLTQLLLKSLGIPPCKNQTQNIKNKKNTDF